MTPAERALMLAVAEAARGQYLGNPSQFNAMTSLIAAVEAEAAPDQPGQSCGDCGNKECELVGEYACYACTDAFIPRQPKPIKADVCPTCNGSGEHTQANSGWVCSDCNGTGKKEKK